MISVLLMRRPHEMPRTFILVLLLYTVQRST